MATVLRPNSKDQNCRLELVQEAEDASDSHMMEYAQSLAGFSPQQMQLTLLGGRRDVSALAAQSAIQVLASLAISQCNLPLVLPMQRIPKIQHVLGRQQDVSALAAQSAI